MPSKCKQIVPIPYSKPASGRRPSTPPLLAATLALLGFGALIVGAPAVPVAAATSAAAPALDLNAYRGKVVYLDFWASWCAPCRLSFPFMRSMNAIYGPRDLAIVTVNLDRDRRAAQQFFQAQGATFPVVYDPAGSIATRFKVATMPTSVLIGRDGRVRFVHRGYFDNKSREYQQQIAGLVAERP